MGRMRKKFEAWILKEEFNQDTFQTFVCWMLFGGTILSFITPAILILSQLANPQQSCESGTFTILAHYRLHAWLYEMFEDFQNESDDTDKCYELIIGNSAFDSSAEPIVWIPESLMWLDIAEDGLSDDETYVNNRSSDCNNLVNIPMGIVTWKSYADALNLGDSPMDYNDFLTLAQDGWSNFTNGAISSDELLFEHAHPNITSSGLLGMVLGYLFLNNQTQDNTQFSFDLLTNNITQDDKFIEYIEKSVYESGPNELSLVTNFLGHGPDYVHAMYGFENIVAYDNYVYNDYLTNFWDDQLAFIYFTSSFWMRHPICVMSGDAASWVTDAELSLGRSFVNYVTNQTRLEKLANYGIRPWESTILSDSDVLNSTYGANINITASNTNVLDFPTSDTVTDLREKWLDLKVPVYLRVLLEVSDNMQDVLSGTETVWSEAIDGLDVFARVLEDDAIYDAQCFAESILSCGGSVEWPNGTLGDSRDDIITFIDDSMVVTQNSNVALYNSLNQSLSNMRWLKEQNDRDGNYMNYVLIVISGDNEYSESDALSADELLDIVGINFDPDEVHIYPILFRGETTSETASTLEEIAKRTNGEFFSTSSGMPTILKSIAWFF